MFNFFNPQQMTQQVTDGAQNMAQQAGVGLLGRIGAMFSGAFGGLFSGGLFWGTAGFLAQQFNLAGPIARAIGGEELEQRIAHLGENPDGSVNIGRRIAASAAFGAAMGAAGGAAGGLIGGPPQPGGNNMLRDVVGIAGALVAGAVLLRTQGGGDSERAEAPVTPAPSATAASHGPAH